MFRAKLQRTTKIKLPDSIKGPQTVKVGMVAGVADQHNIDKAAWNEFGTKGGGWGGPIPERPFLRNAMKENAGKYQSLMAAAAAKIVKGMDSLSSFMSKLGMTAQNDIRASIRNMSSPPNSPVTIAIKGSSSPLIDTGEMLGAVNYKVED